MANSGTVRQLLRRVLRKGRGPAAAASATSQPSSSFGTVSVGEEEPNLQSFVDYPAAEMSFFVPTRFVWRFGGQQVHARLSNPWMPPR